MRHARAQIRQAVPWLAPALVLALAVGVAAALAGCSRETDGADEAGRYVHYDAGFSLVPPDGWTVRQWSAQPCLWLLGPGEDGPGRPTLNVVVTPGRGDETIEETLAVDRRHATALHGYEPLSEETRILEGGTRAALVTYRHEGLGRPVTIRQLRAVAAGRIYTVTAAAASERFGDYEDAFEACFRSLRIRR